MSRLVKESDEEIDVKPGRKTRANIEVISADSPLRRSSRIKPNVKQNESSPESPLSDSSIVSTTQTSRITRQRASAMDNSAINETRRTLRSRISSISSDVNEIPESDVGTPTKKARNYTSNDSNKTNTRKSKRFTRAGSEAKSPQSASRLVKRNVRASSVGPEANTPNKQQHSELANTPIRTRRRTSVLLSEPVVEEKEEYMKYPVVTLDRTLPDLIEIRESGAENSPKTSSKNESLPTSKNKLNTSCNSINEKHSEDDVKGPHNDPPENVSSNNFGDIEKDVFTDKKISDKNILESSKTLPVDNTNEAKSLIDNESKILPQNKDENTFIEDLNNSMEKPDGHNNKENLTTNIVTGLQDIKNAISNTQQSPKHVSINNLNANVSTEEKCKYPCIETSVSPKRRHSKQSLEIVNENVSMKEVNAGVISNLPTEGLDTSMNEEDNSNNMQNLVVGTKTESVIGSPYSESLDKNGPIQVVSTNASSNNNVESMELAEDINTVDDNKSTEIGIELNVESKKAYVHASNANVNIEMDVSNTKENINENEESEQNDINQCITDDQYDTKSKNDNLNMSENVHENDDISCTKLISSPKLSNIDSSNLVDVKSVSDTHRLTISKHEDVPFLKNISETNNLSPNTSNLLKSSDAHMSIEDSTLINMNKANVTNVIKSSDSSIVTETPAEFVEEAPERGEQSKKVSVLDDSTDPLKLKKQYQNKLESNEKHTNTIQVTSEECQENIKADDNDSDTSVSHTFQDISASEWKEKNNDMDKNSIHSKTTENESEAECDLVLVDREAWLAAENLKINKEKISFDYDSDDTVILKAHSDSMKAKNENNLMDISQDECKLNDSKDKSPKGKKQKNTKQNENKDEEENRNTVEDTKNITKDEEISINVGENTSTTKDSNKCSTPNSNMSLRKSLKNNSLSESYETTEGEKNLSLNKSKLSEDVPKGRKSLNKSVQGANRLEESNAAETVKKLKSLNKSNCNENIVTSAKKNGTNQSLNTSKEKMKPRQLDENSEESDYDLKKVCEKQDSATKKKLNRNFSTIANVGSDSNESQNSDDSHNKLEIPKFLFCGTSDSNSDNDSESNSTINSDIQKEYNFYGKDVAKFSDDDVPGDECRASETESSDPDDNGSDLADFVVDDDEIEGEEEDESEENKDGSFENDKLQNEEQTKEDQRDDEEGIGQETIQKEQHENDKENIAEKSISKETDASNEEKNTSRKSGDLSMSQTIRSDKKKNKNLKTDRSQIEENEKGDNPDLSFETKRKKQKRNSKEFTVKSVEQSLNDSQLIFDTKVLKLRKSMECSTPKISVSKQQKLNVKTCGAEENDSLDEENDEDLTLKEEQNVKKLRSIKNNETLMHRSLPSELTDLATKTNLSRPMSSKVPELNKSTIVLGSETPTTKYLRPLKLNESAPILNANFKKLTNTSNSNEQNDQGEEENENNDEQNTKAAPGPNDSLKKKLLKVVKNILESDHQKKRKKRKQPIVEKVTKSTLSETDFPENNDSKLLKTAKQFVPTSNIDNNNETEKENKKKRKKKKKRNNTDVQMQEESDQQVTEIQSESQDEKIHNEIKKKKKKEKKVPDVQDVQDLTNEKTKIVKKKKKKVVLSDDDIPNEQLLKNKQKLLAKDAALQDKKALLEKLPKKKRELLSEDDALQYEEVPPKKVPKKKQKLSSDVSDQKENTSVQKSSKKKQKQLLEGVKTDNIKYTVASNKTQQFYDAVSDSDEGPETITFSKARDEALKDLKRTADNIKANKEMKKKKQREHNEKMQKQKEIKIKQSKSKNQVTEFSKTGIQEKGIKQLPDYIVKNLSDVPLKSSKKRKLSEEKSSLSPTCSFKPKKMKNIYIEDDITLPSCAGNTTEFSVVDIETIKKKKTAPKAGLFREKMLARNPRQHISAYLTYLKKQKSLDKGKFYDKPY